MEAISLSVPGSKSITNRALLLAALAKGESHLKNILWSDDTEVMIEALRALGTEIQLQNKEALVKSTGEFAPPSHPLYLGNAGTAVRFLTAILSHCPFESEIKGDARMNQRPIQDLLTALESLGAKIKSNEGCPPLKIHGKALQGCHVEIQGKNSSQYVSALLMLAPLLSQGLTIQIKDHLTSRSYVDITLNLMNKFFIQNIEKTSAAFKIPHQSYHPTQLTLEADASSASYFFGLAAITGSTLHIRQISRKSLQPDIQILSALEQMGCHVTEENQGITVVGPPKLKALGTVDANDFPDGAITLALVATQAHGKTQLTGLQNLRIKESDRLHAITTELKKMNVDIQELSDGWIIKGNPQKMKGATIDTYNDHRIAMAFGMLGCQIPGVTIENPDCVKKTYPGFWKDLKTIRSDKLYPHFT